MKTNKITIPACLLLLPLLLAAKCQDDDKAVDADSPSSLCDHFFDLCGENLFGGDHGLCEEEIGSKESCRKECLAEQDSCDMADACLNWQLNSDGPADEYCDAGGDYSNLDECAAGACASSYNACNVNSACIGIFDDCLSGCADWDCVELCASLGYADGIADFNALSTCLDNNCADFV